MFNDACQEFGPSPRARMRRGAWRRAGPRALVLAAILMGAASAARAAEVAVLFSAKVAEYDEALRGFEEASGYRIVAEYNMQGNFDEARKQLDEIAQKKPDLIFALGLWALRAALDHGSDIPIIYAMVLNPPSVVGGNRSNVTGASMNVAPVTALRLLKQLGPGIRRIGVVFNEEKTGYLVREAQTVAQAEGLELVTRAVRSAGEAVPALKSLQEVGIDAFWIVPDETILAPTVVKHVFRFSYRNGVPTVGISERQAEMGALLAVSFGSTRDIGRQAGELAKAATPGSGHAQAYTTVRDVAVTVNLKVAEKLGVEVPESILVGASKVIR